MSRAGGVVMGVERRREERRGSGVEAHRGNAKKKKKKNNAKDFILVADIGPISLCL